MIKNKIEYLRNNLGVDNPLDYFLNGGCYIFAKKLQQEIGGDILYLVNEYHFVIRYDEKLYDVTGNVTSKYKDSKVLSEEEFLNRRKLVSMFKT